MTTHYYRQRQRELERQSKRTADQIVVILLLIWAIGIWRLP